MKKLLLLRHADARTGSVDHARCLSELGKSQAASLSLRLKRDGLVPDLVLCSSATRTQQTVDELQRHLDLVVRLVPAFYNAGLAEIRAELLQLPSDCEFVCVVGHNPGWSEAAMELSREPIRFLPSEGVLLASVHDQWELAAWGTWTIAQRFSQRER